MNTTTAQWWSASVLAGLLIGCGIEEPERREPAPSSDWVQNMGHKVGKGDSPWTSQGWEMVTEMDWANDPANVVEIQERRLDALPLQGEAKRTPWSDSYWPRYKGGIGQRWVDKGFKEEAPLSAAEAHHWSREDLARLSPSEKYDLFVGNYDYTLTRKMEAMNQPGTPSWQGYCHGWTMASIHFEEPGPIDATNPDGVVIPFGSSDIKALLTFYQGDVLHSLYGTSVLPFTTEVKVGGGTCLSSHPTDPSCNDANPGMFHLVMTNQLGLRSMPFGIDATAHREKWNQPVYAYRTEILGARTPGPGASSDAVREVIVRSEVTYGMEIEPRWEPVLGTEHQHAVTKTYTYTLELNSFDEVIGGQWILLMEDMSTPTFEQAWNYVSTVDNNHDGHPDNDEHTAKEILWGAFDFPDYVWFQSAGAFSEEFRPTQSGYDFLSSSTGAREDMWQYFAHLKGLYEAAAGVHYTVE